MQNKIKKIINTYDDLTDQLSDPKIISNPPKFRDIAKHHHNLEPVVQKGREYIKLIEQIVEYRSILDGDDPDLKVIAKEEIDDLFSQQEQQENELKILLLPKDQRDSKNTIIEIRAGTGGEDDHIARRQITDGGTAIIMFYHATHRDGRHHARADIGAL